ncbi:hypothetical protein ACGO3R_05845 [Lactococcus lactis]
MVNHQGWNSFSSQWDGVNSWNGEATNLENSYIEYAGVNNPVDFALRKYAKETETPGLYDVYLNVRGNVQNPIKPVDIVLVIDMSGSMQGAKETAVRQGVSDFYQRFKTLLMQTMSMLELLDILVPGIM